MESRAERLLQLIAKAPADVTQGKSFSKLRVPHKILASSLAQAVEQGDADLFFQLIDSAPKSLTDKDYLSVVAAVRELVDLSSPHLLQFLSRHACSSSPADKSTSSSVFIQTEVKTTCSRGVSTERFSQQDHSWARRFVLDALGEEEEDLIKILESEKTNISPFTPSPAPSPPTANRPAMTKLDSAIHLASIKETAPRLQDDPFDRIYESQQVRNQVEDDQITHHTDDVPQDVVIDMSAADLAQHLSKEPELTSFLQHEPVKSVKEIPPEIQIEESSPIKSNEPTEPSKNKRKKKKKKSAAPQIQDPASEPKEIELKTLKQEIDKSASRIKQPMLRDHGQRIFDLSTTSNPGVYWSSDSLLFKGLDGSQSFNLLSSLRSSGPSIKTKPLPLSFSKPSASLPSKGFFSLLPPAETTVDAPANKLDFLDDMILPANQKKAAPKKKSIKPNKKKEKKQKLKKEKDTEKAMQEEDDKLDQMEAQPVQDEEVHEAAGDAEDSADETTPLLERPISFADVVKSSTASQEDADSVATLHSDKEDDHLPLKNAPPMTKDSPAVKPYETHPETIKIEITRKDEPRSTVYTYPESSKSMRKQDERRHRRREDDSRTSYAAKVQNVIVVTRKGSREPVLDKIEEEVVPPEPVKEETAPEAIIPPAAEEVSGISEFVEEEVPSEEQVVEETFSEVGDTPQEVEEAPLPEAEHIEEIVKEEVEENVSEVPVISQPMPYGYPMMMPPYGYPGHPMMYPVMYAPMPDQSAEAAYASPQPGMYPHMMYMYPPVDMHGYPMYPADAYEEAEPEEMVEAPSDDFVPPHVFFSQFTVSTPPKDEFRMQAQYARLEASFMKSMYEATNGVSCRNRDDKWQIVE